MRVDWELVACGIRGHTTYRPDEPEIAERVHATGPDGDCWRCLRCGAFVQGEPTTSGPAAQVPAISRGALLRDAVIMRLLAVDRWFHFVLLTVVGALLLTMRQTERKLSDEFAHEFPRLDPILSQLGLNVADSKTLHLLDDVFTLSPAMITWIGVGVLAYAVAELIEGTGLWVMQRWGEYFSVVVTSALIPVEIYELTDRVTAFKLAALIINVAAVVWLIWRKRLFGARGGRKAYDAERAQHSLLDA